MAVVAGYGWPQSIFFEPGMYRTSYTEALYNEVTFGPSISLHTSARTATSNIRALETPAAVPNKRYRRKSCRAVARGTKSRGPLLTTTDTSPLQNPAIRNLPVAKPAIRDLPVAKPSIRNLNIRDKSLHSNVKHLAASKTSSIGANYTEYAHPKWGQGSEEPGEPLTDSQRDDGMYLRTVCTNSGIF